MTEWHVHPKLFQLLSFPSWLTLETSWFHPSSWATLCWVGRCCSAGHHVLPVDQLMPLQFKYLLHGLSNPACLPQSCWEFSLYQASWTRIPGKMRTVTKEGQIGMASFQWAAWNMYGLYVIFFPKVKQPTDLWNLLDLRLTLSLTDSS